MPKRPLTNIEAIEKLNQLGLKYDFGKFQYNGNRRNTSIVICSEHGEFLSCYHDVFKSKYSGGLVCKKCRNNNQQIKIFTNIHGNNFVLKEHLINIIKRIDNNHIDINRIPNTIKYFTNKSPINLYCKIHGEFIISYKTLKLGCGCPDCNKNNNKRSRRTYDLKYIQKLANKKNGVCIEEKYLGRRIKHRFKCENGNIFSTSPDMIERKDKDVWCNCKLCKPRRSSKGEDSIEEFLIENNISYEKEKRFTDLRSDANMKLPFDFYLPDYNILIEYDGKQHYEPVKYYGGEKTMLRTQVNDKIKNSYVRNSCMCLIRIPYTEKQNIKSILISYIIESQIDNKYFIRGCNYL